MIPTMILFGLLLGRWWKVTVPLAGVVWVLLLVSGDMDLSPSEMAGAGVLGAINAAVGAVVYLAAARGVGALARTISRARERRSQSVI